MELVFATHNQNKFREIKALLPSNITLMSLSDIGCEEDIPETGDTIDENAILKAEYVRNNYGYDCFADDTGLEIEALAGAPGVYSARYAGEQKDDQANIQKVLKQLEERDSRRARFKTVIALNLKGNQNLFTGICEGHILKEKRGINGFGYDPIFQALNSQYSFAEMNLTEKARISHRSKAFRELMAYLSK